MTFGSLFAGIGGLDLGLERAGMECRWQVEIDPFCRQVLEKHWPGVKRYGDIRNVHGTELEPVDLICGGFPCQDLSQAGKRIGIEGTRSGLWFEFARIVGMAGPRYVLIENVPGLLVPDAMRRVVGELARLRYVGSWRCLRASEFGASHLRKRVFLVAYRIGIDSERRGDAGIVGAAPSGEPDEGLQRQWTGHAINDSGNDLAYREDDGHTEWARNSGDQWSILPPESLAGRRETSRPSEPVRRGGNVAYRKSGELGELRESSGGDGLFDRSDTELADTEHSRPDGSERKEFRTDGPPLQATRSGEGDESLANAGLAIPRWRNAESYNLDWPGTPNFDSGTGGALAHTDSAGFSQQCGTGTVQPELRSAECGSDAPLPDRHLGNAAVEGGPRWSESREHDTASGRRSLHSSGVPLQFAPGPADSRWPAILTDRPDLAPALEPAVRGMADGSPDWLDRAMRDRTKRLGRLGNAVVPQVAEWIGRKILEYDNGTH